MEDPHPPKVGMEKEGAAGGYPFRVTSPTSPPPSQQLPESLLSLRRKMQVKSSSSVHANSTSEVLPGQPVRSSSEEATTREGLEQEEEVSDEDTSSECEASSPEEESSDDEDSGARLPLDIHPIHIKQTASGVKLPIMLPGCTDAKKMALTAATDSKVGIRQARLMRTKVETGKLTGAGPGFTLEVDLLFASVAVEPCVGPLAQGQVVVSIVPARIDPGSVQEAKRARWPSSSVIRAVKDTFSVAAASLSSSPPTAEKEVLGYLFYCALANLESVMSELGRSGCYLTDIARNYKVMKGERARCGSFGTVVAAQDLEGNLAAIKRMKESTRREVLEQEVKMLVLSQGHPNVIRFYACYREEEPAPRPSAYNLVFAFYSRGDLYDRVAEGSRIQEKQAMTPLRDLFDALAHLHARGIFHRDVKPENLLVVNNSIKVVLTDFGIATLTSDTEALKKTVGTVGYASPEMLAGKASGYEGDAFGAGIVLYFILSRSTPFLAPTTALMAAKTQQCQVNLNYQCFEAISDDCRSMMTKLLAKNVEDRMTVEEALQVPTVKRTFVTATEPSLASMDRKKRSSAPASGEVAKAEVPKPVHHMVALSVGQLPPLQKIPLSKNSAES